MKAKRLIFFIIVIIFFACKEDSNIMLVLEENGYKKLDSIEEPSSLNIRFHEIGSKIKLLSFYNRNEHSINIYDYNSNNLINSIKLKKEGNNSITTPMYWLDYHIHNLDSIFISNVKNYYLINSLGKVLSMQTPNINTNYFKINKPVFNKNTIYANGDLSFEIEQLLPNEEDTIFLLRTFDFFNNTVKNDFIDIRDVINDYDNTLKAKKALFKAGGFDIIPKHIIKYNEFYIVSTPINDSISIFKNGELLESYFVSDSLIKIATYQNYFGRKKIIKHENYSAITDNLNQPPFFTNMLCHGKFLYRILSHGTKPNLKNVKEIYPENLQNIVTGNEYEFKGVSLCIFNLETKKTYTFSIPINDLEIPLDDSKVFLSDEGIHFPIKSNNNSSQILYKLFKIKELN
jgi:hypothetical protein